ncbi:MAG: ATP-binding cassette domain-containing protein [Actinomycetota bacterium]|nr:ATP-binding cassette domain-containing protein [Actinomycetota bacterium]
MDIEFNDVTKRYGGDAALDGVSFTARSGRVTGFVGRNGAGKTTALRVLLGLTQADAGTATIGGRLAQQLEAGTVGVSLEAAFHPGRTGRAHLRYLAVALGLGSGAVEEMLEELDLGAVAQRRVRGYSLGQRQRLGLASGLLGRPRVLVLDEPANGLDPGGVLWLRDRLRSAASQGTTVLVSSHVLSELEHVIDDVVVLDCRVLWTGCREDVVDRAGTLEELFKQLSMEEAA